MYPEWERVARDGVGGGEVTESPYDRGLSNLIGEQGRSLTVHSAEPGTPALRRTGKDSEALRCSSELQGSAKKSASPVEQSALTPLLTPEVILEAALVCSHAFT
ncbi:hypothetical protein GCM10010206_63690 [Streptomyces cinerochromogenes]|nr:hypothetical protein GCM10010206_63690 [Streptomyces cinerochromogenes]